MREDTLPVEFAGLQGKVHYVRRVTAGEWSSSCPQCGGAPHKGGEFPDRFRMWVKNKSGNTLGWCRRCNFYWTPENKRQMARHEFEQWRKDMLAAEERRKADAERAIKLLKSEKAWECYHEQLSDWSVEVLRSWGIRKDWADYWKLGFYPDYKCYNRQDGEYHTPAITIPIWQHDWDLRNIKVRTLNPKRDSDRYRALYKTGHDYPFVAFPVLKTNKVLVVEGEKKAMVAAEWSDQKFQVIGVPSKTPSVDSLQVLDRYDTIYLCLDPDARVGEGMTPQRRLIDILGKERVRVVNLPRKVDDMIVENKLNIHNALKYARLEE